MLAYKPLWQKKIIKIKERKLKGCVDHKIIGRDLAIDCGVIDIWG